MKNPIWYNVLPLLALLGFLIAAIATQDELSLTANAHPNISANEYRSMVDENFDKLSIEKQIAIYEGCSFETQEQIRRYWWTKSHDEEARLIANN